LETLGDKELSKGIVALMEDQPLPSTPANAIESLLNSKDLWTRVLAAGAVSELALSQFIPKLYELLSDPHPFMRASALSSLFDLHEELPMETLQTISTVERVLILQEIPIFANLPPEDLERIALIAREQWHPPAGVICRQGEEGDVMYVIVSGLVQIITEYGGRAQVLAERGPGEIIGELAIIDPAPRMIQPSRVS
jgi:hypothetical protein